MAVDELNFVKLALDNGGSIHRQKDENDTETKTVAYQNFVAILVEAIKELNEKFDT